MEKKEKAKEQDKIPVDKIVDLRFIDKDGSTYRLEEGRTRGLYSLTKEG